jgi:hypothetical protein
MTDAVKQPKFEKIDRKARISAWFWPLALASTRVAGVSLLAFRGCWHRRIGWPVRMQDHSYQVCLECGAKRLFDEKKFRSYGPFRHDLNEFDRMEKGQQA